VRKLTTPLGQFCGFRCLVIEKRPAPATRLTFWSRCRVVYKGSGSATRGEPDSLLLFRPQYTWFGDNPWGRNIVCTCTYACFSFKETPNSLAGHLIISHASSGSSLQPAASELIAYRRRNIMHLCVRIILLLLEH